MTNEEYREKSDKMYEQLGLRIKKWREAIGKEQKQIEEECNIRNGRLSKIETANAKARIEILELSRIADAMGISCDELIKGYSIENQKLSESAILTNEAIDILRKMKQNAPDYIEMLNIIFRKANSDLRNLLFDSLLLYANCEMFKISLGTIENGFSYFLRDERRKNLVKAMSLSFLSTALEKFRNDWKPIVEERIDSAIREQLRDMVRHMEASSEQIKSNLEEEYLRDVSDDDIS